MLSGHKISPKLWRQQRNAFSHYELEVTAFRDYPATQLKALITKLLPGVRFIDSNIADGAHRIAISLPAKDLDLKLNQLAAAEAIQCCRLQYGYWKISLVFPFAKDYVYRMVPGRQCHCIWRNG